MRCTMLGAAVLVSLSVVTVMAVRKRSVTGSRATNDAVKVAPTLPFTKTSKLLVIGAGPAGVHMASKLVKNGYEDITVLEKTDRVGGKSYTLFENNDIISPEYSDMGDRHEMGTCYLHVAYHHIRQLIEEYGVMEKPYEIVPPGRSVYYHDNAGKEAIMEMEEYVKASVKDSGSEGHNWTSWVAGKSPAVGMVAQINNYIKAHKAVFPTFGKDAYMPPRPTAEQLTAIDMTFHEFLQKHNCVALEGFLRLAMTAQGYGIPELMPALYGLWWVTPELLINTLKVKIPGQGQDQLTMLKDGYAKLWQTIARTDKLKVIHHADVQAVTRKNDKVQATYAVNGGDASEKEFDFLILAMPFKRALTFLKDADDTEKEIFSSLKAATLVTTLVKTAPIPGYTTMDDHKSVAYFYDGLQAKPEGELNCMRYSKAALTGEAGYDESVVGEQTQVTYQFYPPGRSPREEGQDLPPFKRNEKVLQELIKSAKARNIIIKEENVLEQFPWPYMFQFDQDGINKEYPWEIFDMNLRASKQTWYIGGSACFESVLDVTDYNNHLLSEFGIKDETQRGKQTYW